jgi:hypothetical protein
MTNQRSSSQVKRRSMLLALATLPFAAACASTPRAVSSSIPIDTAAVPSGMYAVVADASQLPSKDPARSYQTLRYDPKMADAESTEPVQLVTVETHSFVPLILGAAPEPTKQENGSILVSVALSPKYIKTLADFTRAHLGERVALVLDGEVVSTHKVRTVIEGGRMQITRCDDHACQRILSKLATSWQEQAAPRH